MKNLKNKNILISGGSGFIGSHLCSFFLHKKENMYKIKEEYSYYFHNNEYYIYCLDNLFSGNINNINNLLKNNRFKFNNLDVRNEKKILNFYRNIKFDYIFNFACPASPIHYQKDPIYTIETAFLGTSNLLKKAVKDNAIFFQASTSEIYGDPLVTPQIESYFGNVNTIGIRSCYDEGKRIGETLCSDYHNKYGIDIRIGRIFNTFGPNMCINDGRVISEFIVKALLNQDLVINGSGTQTRSFCYIDTLLEQIIDLVFFNNSLNKNLPVNIGNDEIELSINDLALKIRKMIQNDRIISKIIYKDALFDEPQRRFPNLNKIKEISDFYKHKISIDDGLKLTIEYFKQIIN